MKSVMAGIFGFSVATMVQSISPYTLVNWQWWAAVIPVIFIGIIYANMPDE